MWTTVLLLAIAVNVEPVRIGLLPLLLSRDRPMLQLLAYLAGNLTFSAGFGLAVLFVFRQNPFSTVTSGGGKVQIAVGATALVVAVAVAVRELTKRNNEASAGPDTTPAGASVTVDKMTAAGRRVLQRSQSPWVAMLVGIGLSLPSIDFLAVLLVIATSGTPPAVQIAALLTTVVLSNMVILAPLIGHVLSPAKTRSAIERFTAWTRSRSTLEYAGLLALVGVVLIGLGWSHL